MRKQTIRRGALLLAAALCLAWVPGAMACTAVYVGRDASADGTVMIAKSNDYQAVWPNHVTLTERV